MKQTQLLFSPQYPLNRSDFSPVPLHKVIFNAIVKMAQEGCNSLTEIEIDNYLQSHPEQLEIATDNNFMEFVETTKELSSTENYEAYYKSIRKFSLLRDLKSQGFDITDYYDEAKDETDECANLEKYSIQDILNDVELRGVKLRNKYDVNYVRDEQLAGEDTESLLAEFEVAPSFGAFLTSPYLTQLFQGLNKGHLIMRSSSSGVGKTRMSIADLCGLSSQYLWSEEEQDFIENPNCCGAGLFIHTEMSTRKEVNPIFLSAVSGVDNNKILNGQLSKEEKSRVIKAGDILTQSQILICDMPDFTSKSIERKIKSSVESMGVENVVFDYMQLNASLAEEFKQRNGGVPSREDLVVRSLATDLKAYAEKYNVRMITSSQLNGNEKTMDCPDESCLSSAKSIKQKLDAGCIVISAKERQKDMKIIEPLLKRKGFGGDREPVPNVITYVYKSRFGLYADAKLKIFSYFDRGTMRMTDYLVVDAYNTPVSIPKPMLGGEF